MKILEMADKNEINLPRGAIKKAYTAKPYYEFCPECRVGSLQVSLITNFLIISGFYFL